MIRDFFSTGIYVIMAGAIIVVVALIFSPPHQNWVSETRKKIFALLLLLGMTAIGYGGYYGGFANGVLFSTYQTAKLFTAPVAFEMLDENVTYVVLRNMPDKKKLGELISLVGSEERSCFLVRGLRVPEQGVFIKKDREIFILDPSAKSPSVKFE